jgi:hypothetical protein
MKTILYKILILTLLLPGIIMAGTGKGKYTKEKKISKAFAVNNNAGTTISNRYGSVYITAWDENRTEIDVTVKVSGNDEDDVTKRLSGINVEFSGTKASVVAKTIIDNFRGKNTNLEVNYTIKIPKYGTVGVANQYGAIRLGKIYGDINLSCQYGEVSIDELNGDSNTLKLQYCDNGKINYCKNADITAQYSDFQLERVGNLQLNSQYSDVSITAVGSLSYKCQYADLNVRSASKLIGLGSYSDLSLGTINELLNITTNYGDLTISKLGKQVKNVTIVNTYADVKINFDPEIAFDFEITGSYSDVSGLGNFKVNERVEKSSSVSYKGYYQKSNVGRLYIRSQYGDIEFVKN